MLLSKEILLLSLLNKNLNLLFYIIALVSVMPMISMKMTVFALIPLARISFYLLRPFPILHLH